MRNTARILTSIWCPPISEALTTRTAAYLIAARFLQKVSRLRAAKERGEDGGINQHDVSGPLLVRRHPQEAVELAITGLGERMRSVQIDRLPCKHLDGAASCQFVMRQMRMEVEGRHVIEKAEFIEVAEGCKRSNFACAFHDARVEDHRRLCTGTSSPFISERVY